MIGKIYKIIHLQSNICYIGSTFNILRQRWQQHKQDYSKWLDGKNDNIAIYPYFKEYGIENFKIILIKEYEVVDRKHLEVYECLWVNKLKPCNNKNPFQLPLKKHYMNIYREKNKERLKQLDKINQIKNDTRIKARKGEVIECECGTSYSRGNSSYHFKSEKHKQFLLDGIVISNMAKYICFFF